MTKLEREQIRNMFGGCCAYCGKTLGPSFHVDHKTPMHRGTIGAKERDKSAVKFPSCVRCNIWKKTYSVEQFRQEIKAQIARIRRDSSAFCLAEDFGLVTENVLPVTFYFERFGDEAKQWAESLQRAEEMKARKR